MQSYQRATAASLEPVDLSVWVGRLRERAKRGDEYPIFPYLLTLEDLALAKAPATRTFRNDTTLAGLGAEGVSVPAIDEELIALYWRRLIADGALDEGTGRAAARQRSQLRSAT